MIPSELPCFIRQCFYKSCAWKTPCVCGNRWGDNGLTWRLAGSSSSLSFSLISRLVAYMRHALLLDAAFRRRKSRFTAIILDLTRLGHSCSFHGGRQVYIWWKPSEYNLLDIDELWNIPGHFFLPVGMHKYALLSINIHFPFSTYFLSRPFLIFSLSFSFDPHCRQAFLCFEARQEVLKPIERSTAAARKTTPRAPQSATTNANAQQQDNISHKGTARK